MSAARERRRLAGKPFEVDEATKVVADHEVVRAFPRRPGRNPFLTLASAVVLEHRRRLQVEADRASAPRRLRFPDHQFSTD